MEKCVVPLYCTQIMGLVFQDISCEKDTPQCFFNGGKSLFSSGKPDVTLEANDSVSRFHEYYFTNVARNLSASESAMITLTRVSDLNPNVSSREYTVTAAFNVNGSSYEEVELVPGWYEVSGIIYYNAPLTIAEEERCVKYDIITWEEETCFTLNKTVLNKSMEGVIEWNTPKTYLKITPDDLYTSSNIEFDLLAQDLVSVPENLTGRRKECITVDCETKSIRINGRVSEDLQLVGQMANLSREVKFRQALAPRFS